MSLFVSIFKTTKFPYGISPVEAFGFILKGTLTGYV